jgi:hypothetical protein
MTTITDWRTLVTGSHRALRDAVAGVPSGAWGSATPCELWNATVEPLRGFAYAPAIDSDGTPEPQLVAYLGRRPDWSDTQA